MKCRIISAVHRAREALREKLRISGGRIPAEGLGAKAGVRDFPITLDKVLPGLPLAEV